MEPGFILGLNMQSLKIGRSGTSKKFELPSWHQTLLCPGYALLKDGRNAVRRNITTVISEAREIKYDALQHVCRFLWPYDYWLLLFYFNFTLN